MKKLFKDITKIDILAPPKSYIDELLGSVCHHLGFVFATVIVVDEQGQGRMFASHNLPDNYMNIVNRAAPVLSSPSGEAVRTGNIVVEYNPLAEKRLKPWWDIIRQNDIATIAWVPLLNEGRAFGTFNIYLSRVRKITQKELETLEQLGVIISIAMASNHYLSRLNSKTRELELEVARRKQAEKATREGERFLTSILTSIQDGLCVLDDQFNIIRVNNTVERLYSGGMPVIGEKCYRVFNGRDDVCDRCPAYRTLMTGESDQEVISTRNELGEVVRWSEIYSFPFIEIFTGNISGVTMYIRDVTEKRRIEQEMSRFEMLNLIEEMAAGIGHELRNPMTTVRGFLQLLGGKMECVRFKNYFNVMIDELDRANTIISKFLSLSKNGITEFNIINLNSVINYIYPLIVADAMSQDKHVEARLKEVPDLPMDENEIRQLLLNLVRNGLEAMEPGGLLTISTSASGDEVLMSVTDQGQGIVPEVLEKIGTPFYSTKDNGTGLGLALCYSIAARHNAVIKIDTDVRGSTFTVCFGAGIG